ncbi:MAG: hypothetical protein D6743_07700 [Calditrichaeota bacterium]|nr:MAG: hypothetical protein D6743_07700 [Calditrichota bacterium]
MILRAEILARNATIGTDRQFNSGAMITMVSDWVDSSTVGKARRGSGIPEPSGSGFCLAELGPIRHLSAYGAGLNVLSVYQFLAAQSVLYLIVGVAALNRGMKSLVREGTI